MPSEDPGLWLRPLSSCLPALDLKPAEVDTRLETVRPAPGHWLEGAPLAAANWARGTWRLRGGQDLPEVTQQPPSLPPGFSPGTLGPWDSYLPVWISLF